LKFPEAAELAKENMGSRPHDSFGSVLIVLAGCESSHYLAAVVGEVAVRERKQPAVVRLPRGRRGEE
jgi:hypothetical protein